jgi:hypothetical protein
LKILKLLSEASLTPLRLLLELAARKIYASPFVDSDWIIEVYVHRVKDEEIEALSAGLKKNAEQDGGGQPATRSESK